MRESQGGEQTNNQVNRSVRCSQVSELRIYLCNFVISNIPSHLCRDWFYRRVMGFKLHTSAAILLDVRFGQATGFEMGANSILNEGCRVRNAGGIVIGKNVSVSPWVKLLTADHDTQSATFTGRSLPIVIQDYAFIGAGAIILGGVTVSSGAVVASGSVVTKTVDAFSIVAGVPAKPIGQRRQDLDYKLGYRRLFH